jgi:type II secretory pathway pseudopilin PulG
VKNRLRSQSRRLLFEQRTQGFSLIGFLCTLLVFGVAGVLALRAGPGLIEYWAVEKAVKAARATSNTPEELRGTFDKLAAAGFIDAIEGKDLTISGRGDDMQVSFAYQKKIPLYGPTSLVIDYRGSTAEVTDTGKASEGAAKQ